MKFPRRLAWHVCVCAAVVSLFGAQIDPRIATTYDKLRLSFEKNAGQYRDASADYVAHGARYPVGLSGQGASIAGPGGASGSWIPRKPAGTPPFTGELDVNVTASSCGAPAAAQAYVFNATVVPPGKLGYLTLWPQGVGEPLVSTLNAVDGAITSNMAIVPTSNGSIAAEPSSATQLVLDLFGYFAP